MAIIHIFFLINFGNNRKVFSTAFGPLIPETISHCSWGSLAESRWGPPSLVDSIPRRFSCRKNIRLDWKFLGYCLLIISLYSSGGKLSAQSNPEDWLSTETRRMEETRKSGGKYALIHFNLHHLYQDSRSIDSPNAQCLKDYQTLTEYADKLGLQVIATSSVWVFPEFIDAIPIIRRGVFPFPLWQLAARDNPRTPEFYSHL